MSATTNAGQILEQQLLEAQILHRVNAATSDDPRRVLEIICTEIAKTLNADSVAFGRLSDAGDSLEIIAEYCQNQNAALSTFLPLTEGQITFHTLRERRAVVMDAQNNPDFAVHRKTLEKLGIKNMMIVPIVEHQAIFGALSVDSFIAKNFSIADQQFAMNAVQAAMPALKQMQIIEALRQSQNRFIHLVNKLECIV
ncbi:MAG: GAF domain-containing protein [Deinococcales bacterium]